MATPRTARKKAAVLSLLIGILLLVIKFIAFSMTESQAIFSDAVESIVNVLGASVALWAIHVADQPADQSHPYGHGKMEYFSSAFEGGLIGIASFFLIFESIHILVAPVPVRSLDMGLLLVGLAGLVNLGLGLYVLKKGEREDSAALAASGHHLLTDFWTSLGVILGLTIMLWTGWIWLDATIGLIIGLNLAWTSFHIVKEALDRLADRSDTQLLSTLCEALDQQAGDGIIQVHELRALKFGRFHHFDIHVIMPRFWSLKEGHDRSTAYGKSVLEQADVSGEFAFHIDPCRPEFCINCALKECALRESAFQSRFPFDCDHILSSHPGT
jgi:cation diffusion facilitator family transporter